MVGEDHGPERREVLEPGSGEEDGRARECSGQAGADLPGLHGGVLELERGRIPLGGPSYGGATVARREYAEHLSPGGSVGVHPESGGGLGPDRSLAVVPRGDLDVDAPAPPVGVDVLDLRIGVEHASLGVDGELQLPGGAVPLGVGGPPAVPHPCGLAPARDGALELVVEAHAPDGGALLEQAPAFDAAGPVDGGVVCELGVLEARGGPDVLSGVQALPGGEIADGGRSASA